MNSFSWWTRGDLDGFFGLFVDNLIGSLQNLESAEAAGDSYPVKSSLAANGIGTIAAACFGSCFPTTSTGARFYFHFHAAGRHDGLFIGWPISHCGQLGFCRRPVQQYRRDSRLPGD